MDSFLMLFDNGYQKVDYEGLSSELWNRDDGSVDDEDVRLPPEPSLGNVEYKLKLINPTDVRFERLVSQMKWRLREGRGEAIYEIGVRDNGILAGLSCSEIDSSLQTLQQMALQLDATMTILRERHVEQDKKVIEVLIRKIPDDQQNIEVRVAVLGGADAGKSTLLGVITHGDLDNGKGNARLNMFRHLHEVQSGRTSSISHEILGFNSKGDVVNYKEAVSAVEICANSSKLVTFMDLAGHRKYLRTTVAGLSGYSPHHAMLVVSSVLGIVGMTREHLALTMALEVPFFVVITKIDVAPPGAVLKELQSTITAAGSRKVIFVVDNEDDLITACSNQSNEQLVPIFCVSNVTGQRLELLTQFLYLLSPGVNMKEREFLEQELCEFQIDETFRVPDSGTIVGGLLIKGVIREGMELMIGPLDDGRYQNVKITSIHRNKVPCKSVKASQSASLQLNQTIDYLRKGMVLLSLGKDLIATWFFQATVSVLYHATAIYPGFQTTIHIGNIRQTAVMAGIMTTGGIHTNDKASVLFRFVRRPEYVCVGMRLLFREGKAKGIGKVTQVFPIQNASC
ncbi:GTP-binding protein 2 [Planococcus citri]|uniref:GTP-binding protein 2 n=1 Tax=Planococcus citri TaxID=170843 RepID=UPI0031F95300